MGVGDGKYVTIKYWIPVKELLARHRKSIELINPPCLSVRRSVRVMFNDLMANGFRLSLSPWRSLLRSSGKQNAYFCPFLKNKNTHPSMKTKTSVCLRLSSDAVNDPLAMSIYPCNRQTGPSHIFSFIWVDTVLMWICRIFYIIIIILFIWILFILQRAFVQYIFFLSLIFLFEIEFEIDTFEIDTSLSLFNHIIHIHITTYIRTIYIFFNY
jgi:hypothetical protein